MRDACRRASQRADAAAPLGDDCAFAAPASADDLRAGPMAATILKPPTSAPRLRSRPVSKRGHYLARFFPWLSFILSGEVAQAMLCDLQHFAHDGFAI